MDCESAFKLSFRQPSFNGVVGPRSLVEGHTVKNGALRYTLIGVVEEVLF